MLLKSFIYLFILLYYLYFCQMLQAHWFVEIIHVRLREHGLLPLVVQM